jgi:hypothetical protein
VACKLPDFDFFWGSCVAAAGPVGTTAVSSYPWQQVIEELESEREAMSDSMQSALAALLLRAQVENPDLVARLYLARPRNSGYQNIPPLKKNPPLASISPRQQTYSLLELQQRYQKNLPAAADLSQQSQASPGPKLEPLVKEFERLRWQLRNTEKHLSYHVQWQKAVVEQRGFFAERNRIAALIGEMQTLEKNGGPEDRIAELRRNIDVGVAKFEPTPGLTIEVRAEGMRILPVEVYTDIGDEAFLQSFREGVQEAFNDSEAARMQSFAIELTFHQLTAAALYPEAPPEPGSLINMKKHRSLFPQDVLVLTTGAASTHAWVGGIVILGPKSTNRRTLAHEFGHLLGFSDAYLRSFRGQRGDPYGVVLHEWTGLVDNLMGSPGAGRVNEEMIETLLSAYGNELPGSHLAALPVQ